MRTLKIKKIQLICTVIILLQLVPSQILKYWPSINHYIYQLIYYMKNIGALFLLLYVLSKPRNQITQMRAKKYINIFIPMLLLFILVEVLAAFSSPIVSQYGIRYWTRCVAYFLDKVCILIEVACLYNICKTDVMKYISTTLIIDGFFTLFITIVRTGIVSTLKVFFAVLGIVESETSLKMLEVHELTYCIGICLIYYVFVKLEKKNRMRIVLLTIFFILGGKRIAFAGVLVSGLFAVIVRKKGISKKSIVLIGAIGTSICVGWIALLYNGEVMLLFARYGINVMGRDSLYSYFISRTSFSPQSIGWGLAATTKAMENMTRAEVGNMVNVRGLHNDILKMYIDCGFVGSLIWYMLNLISIPLSILKKFGKKDATLYMALMLFTFISYLTSNIESAFVYQVILILIPLAMGEVGKSNETCQCVI